MLKIIRRLLYGLAILASATGLLLGGIPMVKSVVGVMRDDEYGYDFDITYLYAPAIIILLSMILLAFVQANFMIGKAISNSFLNPDSSQQRTENLLTPTNVASHSKKVATATEPIHEVTANEKLVHLVKPKKGESLK